MYNYYQPQAPIQQRSAFLKGHPVSSIEEVRATMVDFDGSIFYFPDIANNRIYTKQINFDGTALINMFELKPIQPELTTDYVTRNEFNEAVTKLQQLLTPPSPPKEKVKILNTNKEG